MPRKALGLDINRDSITAVQVISGLKGYQVTACAHVAFEENGGLEDGLKQILEGGDLKGDSCVLSIPAGDVSYRNLSMPFKDPRKIRKTLPYEIDSLLPFPIEDLVVDFAIIDRSDQTDILAGAIKKEIVSKYLAKLQPLGIDPEILDVRGLSLVAWLLRSGVVPDHGILLDICKKTSTMVLFIKKRIALIRTFAGNAAHKALTDADDQETKEIESYLESLCKMVRNTIHLFERQYPAVVYPEKIFFTGSETLDQNTGPLLSQFLDIPSEQINLVKDSRIRMNGRRGVSSLAPPPIVNLVFLLRRMCHLKAREVSPPASPSRTSWLIGSSSACKNCPSSAPPAVRTSLNRSLKLGSRTLLLIEVRKESSSS